MKRTHLLLTVLLSMAVCLAQAGQTSKQATKAAKSLANVPRAELAAKSASLVSQAAAADKQDVAVAVIKAALAKAPATAAAVVGAIAQTAPETAPAVAAAAAKLSPSQADVIAKAAAQAAPDQAEKIIMAVVNAAPKSTRTVAEAVVNAVPTLVSNSKMFRVRNQQSLGDGPPNIETSDFTIRSFIVNPDGSVVFNTEVLFPGTGPTGGGVVTPGPDPYRTP